MAVATQLKQRIKKIFQLKVLLCIFLFVFALWYTIGTVQRWIHFSDEDSQRFADFVVTDPIDVTPTDLRYLDQNWPSGESVWFYTATQGSNLLPYSFFLNLEQPGNSDLFRDNKYINKFRYLTQHTSMRNPEGLPIGIVKDSYKGRDYVGFSCAACHTTQLLYNDVAIRIDGAPAASDMEGFMTALSTSLTETVNDKSKRQRFIDAVIEYGDYSNVTDVQVDLKRYAGLIQRYTDINQPVGHDNQRTQYGYSRLDAFGRIYNRVLEHILSADQLRDVYIQVLGQQHWQKIAVLLNPVLDGKDKRGLFARTVQTLQASEHALSPRQLAAVYAALFNPANAPVSYPPLWDTPQHDFVQWNGIVANAGIGPMGRNAGQVIGVFGNLEWQASDSLSWRNTLSSAYQLVSGAGLDKHQPDFTSSIDMRNLRRVEHQLRKLTSPRWQDAKLPNIDSDKAQRGQQLYAAYCQNCHEIINPRDPKRRLVAFMSDTDRVLTDKRSAHNAVKATGYSGILENRYVPLDNGKWLIQKQAPVAALLKLATANAVLGITPEPDRSALRGVIERLYDFISTASENNVQTSLRRGDYEPATSAQPFAPLTAYKARALNGVWATAPYLHNGSVPTLYHLLLPTKATFEALPEDNSCEFETYRPTQFQLGSRQFEPQQVGLRWQGYQGFTFNTAIGGNHNSGHEYAAGNTAQANGKTLACLNRMQRGDLLEFLKTL